jgi:hypothetical protein
MMGIIRELYGDLLWPTPAIIIGQMLSGNTVGGLWDRVSTTAVGRVDPVGEFIGQDGVIEYFVGTLWTGISRVSQVVFHKILAQDNWVASTVDMLFNAIDPSNPEAPPFMQWNYTQSGFFTFNDQDQIQSMDLIIHKLGHAPSPYPVEIVTSCHAILNVAGCNATHDPNGFYTDMDDCITFMQGIEFGNYDNVRQDTVVCRSFHSILAIARPHVHCSHSGKTGTGTLASGAPAPKCTPHPYADYYLKNY